MSNNPTGSKDFSPIPMFSGYWPVHANNSSYNGTAINYRLDYSGRDLPNSNFNYKLMDTCIFHKTNLKSSSFIAASLGGAQFIDADLRGVDFTDANLRGANFAGAKLSRANFTGTILENYMVATNGCLLFEKVLSDDLFGKDNTG